MSKKWKKTPRPRPTTATGIRAAASELPTSLRIEGVGEPLELLAEREGDGGKRLRPFAMTAYTGASMRLEGFYRPVVIDLAGLSAVSKRLPILRSHDPERIVAHSEEIEITDRRVKVSGVMSGVGAAAAEVLATADHHFPWQSSLGASVERMEFVDAGGTVRVNGRSFDGPLLVARQSTLREISFVPLGADPGTSARVAAGNGGGAAVAFNEWLSARGFEPDRLSDGQRKTLEAAFKADTPAPPPGPPPPAPKESRSFDDVLAAARAEEERKTRITEVVAGVMADNPGMLETAEALGRQAIEGKWDTDRLELELLRARRPSGLSLSLPAGEPKLTGEVVEAAVCLRAGLDDIEKHYDARTLEAARRRWSRGLGLAELVLTAAHKNGFRGYNLSGNLHAALKAAFAPDVAVKAGTYGPSTYSLPTIFSNVANKFLAAGFESVDGAWRMIAATRSVNDFKQVTRVTLTGSLIYEQLPPSGEIEHGTVGERTYANKADTYARMLGIARTDLINDDLGALSGAARRLGRGGGLKLNDVFWRVFLNNATFFTAGNNNVLTGVTAGPTNSALGLEGLQNADRLFRLQTDPDGMPLGILPALLVVPTSLRITALNLMQSTNIQTGNTANIPDANPFAGSFQVVSSPYMQNAAYTGNSSTAWYLLASPSDLPAIEVCFLNGVESPTVETADADFNTLGISMRGFHDMGAALQEYRAGVRAAGA